MSKSISINPAFFKISGRSALKKQKKRKPLISAKTLKPNDVKKKLIAKIKEHQKREKEKIMDEQKKQEKVFQDDFKNTLSYLEEMKKNNIQKKRKKERKKTLKKPNILENVKIPINTEINKTPSNIPIHLEPMGSPNKLDAEPPYGCLKGGTKPTWRQWNKTLKKNPDNNESLFNLSIDFQNNNNEFQERQTKLHQLKNKFQTPTPKTHKIRTRRIRKKITLGKVGKKVGVLVKSKKTRKIIKNEVYTLKKKSIQEVKDYLRKHNLVKIGSNAPDHIFRSIYESAYLSGDIKNKNPDILLHNWHKDEEQ